MDVAEKLIRRITLADGAARTRAIATTRNERRVLKDLLDAGKIIRVGYGCYSLTDTPASVQFARLANARLTCVSAVNFAGLRTLRKPRHIHVALDRNRGGLEVPSRFADQAIVHREPIYWENFAEPVHKFARVFPSNNPHPPRAPQLLAPWPALFARVAVCQPLIEAVVAIDSGLNTGVVEKDQILRLLHPKRHKAGIKAVTLTSATSQSVLESLARLELVQSGFKVEPQKQIPNVGFVDLLVEDFIVVELDGFAYHSDKNQFRHDRFRDRELAKLGYQVLRFAYPEVLEGPALISSEVRALLAYRAANGALNQFHRQPLRHRWAAASG